MKVNIKTENAAFTDNKGRECARILRELADRLLERGYPERAQRIPLYDINGNKVGDCRH